MSRNKKMEYQITTQNKLNSEKDDVLKKMLEIRFDQPVTVKVNFQEEEDDLHYLKHEKCMEGLNKVSLDGCTVDKYQGSNDVITLGMQNTHSEGIYEKSNKNHIQKKTEVTITKIESHNNQYNKNNNKESINIKKETRFTPTDTVSVFFENSLSNSQDYLKQDYSMERFNKVSLDGCAVDKFPISNDEMTLRLQNTHHKGIDEKSDQNHIKQKTIETITKIKSHDNQHNNNNNSKESTDIKKETRFTPTETVSVFFENLLSNSRQENVGSAVIDGIKKNYKTFPRIKVTSRRDIQKLPGKISAMKTNINKVTTDKKTPSIVKDISTSISCTFIKPEKNIRNDNETTSTINIESNKSEDIRKNSEYQIIFNDILNDAQPSIKQVNVGLATSSTNATSISVENMSRHNNICDPRYGALRSVAENILGIIPHLNHYLRIKPREAQNKEVFQRAQKQYYATKIQNFHSSYSNVVSYILPHKDNAAYMKSFYQLVNIMATENKLQDFSKYNLEILCSEMIGWAEHKKVQMNAFNTNSLSRIQKDKVLQLIHSLSTQSKMALSRSENITSAGTQTNTQPGALSQRFATGSPRQEIKMNYDPEVHIANKISTSSVQSNLTKNGTVTTNQMSCPSQWQHPALIPNVTDTAIRNKPLHNYYNATPLLQTQQQQNTPLRISTYPQAYVSFISLREPSSRHPLPTYHQNLIDCQIQPQYYQTEDQNSNHVRSMVIPERSSVSRDSGFMSPAGDISTFDRMDVHANYDNDSPAPMTTHGIPMNRHVNYKPMRKCQVCGTITNLRCLGCDRDYYCRPRCQEVAWKTHKAFCHK